MTITAEDFYMFTGILAPADFESCAALAEQQMHGQTLYAYVGVDAETLPSSIRTAWKQAVALQTLAVHQAGGAAGLTQNAPNSVSLGSYSYTGGYAGMENATTGFSSAVKALLPMLVGYARGLMACCPSR